MYVKVAHMIPQQSKFSQCLSKGEVPQVRDLTVARMTFPFPPEDSAASLASQNDSSYPSSHHGSAAPISHYQRWCASSPSILSYNTYFSMQLMLLLLPSLSTGGILAGWWTWLPMLSGSSLAGRLCRLLASALYIGCMLASAFCDLWVVGSVMGVGGRWVQFFGFCGFFGFRKISFSSLFYPHYWKAYRSHQSK